VAKRDLWHDIFTPPPEQWCPGCGYYRAATGQHRDDCTATTATEDRSTMTTTTATEDRSTMTATDAPTQPQPDLLSVSADAFCNSRHPDKRAWCRRLAGHDGSHSAFTLSVSRPESWPA
jgi:hypothetical protein